MDNSNQKDQQQSTTQNSSFDERVDNFADKLEKQADNFNKRIESEFKEEKKTGDVVWALVLIFVGTMLLLNSLGLVSWAIWIVILRFWPVLLILGGLQLIFGKHIYARIVIGVLAFFMFGFISLIAIYNSAPSLLEQFNITLPDQVVSVLEIDADEQQSTYALETEKYEDVTSRILTASLGVGELSIVDGGNDDTLISIDSSYGANFGQPDINDKQEDDSVVIAFSQASKNTWYIGGVSPEYRLDLGMNRLPTSIFLEVGAGKGVVDLEESVIKDLDVDVGAGSVEVTLGDNVSYDEEATINVNVGAGEMILELGKDVAYTVVYNVGVGSVRVKSDDFSGLGRDGSVTSENIDTAEASVTINVDVGLGQFRLK